jgi:hypothetical protein
LILRPPRGTLCPGLYPGQHLFAGEEELAPGAAVFGSGARNKNMALEKELAVFNSKLAELKAEHEGKFVLIHGDEIVDFFSSYDDAIKAGYAKFGLESFLVKQVQAMEQIQFISRFVDPCAMSQAR